MKAFLVYTALRLMLFVTALIVIGGLFLLVGRLTAGSSAGFGSTEVLIVIALAALVSAIGSWKLLGRQREELARIVQGRADRASEALERSRSKEDVD